MQEYVLTFLSDNETSQENPEEPRPVNRNSSTVPGASEACCILVHFGQRSIRHTARVPLPFGLFFEVVSSSRRGRS